MASETNEVEQPPAGERWRMVTVRMSHELHGRLLAASNGGGKIKDKPSVNRLCVAAIEAALGEGESARDRERRERIALEARFGARFDALGADDLAREAAEIAGGNLLLKLRASPLLRELIFERWEALDAAPADAR